MSSDIIDNNLRNVIHLCYEMLELADHGDKFRQDSGCGVVFGTLRDEAYKIRQLAENELLQHSRKSKKTSKKPVKKAPDKRPGAKTKSADTDDSEGVTS